jgi:site-specific recombinase XerC
MTRVLLSSLTQEQVKYLIEQAETVRDKAIISLFADSGIRLNELVNIKESHIDWKSQTVVVWGKGGKQRKAPFTTRTADLLKLMFRVNRVNRVNGASKNIWGLERRGIQIMLYRLQEKTDGFVAAAWPVFGILREWCKE